MCARAHVYVCVCVAHYVSLIFVYRLFSVLPDILSHGDDDEEGDLRLSCIQTRFLVFVCALHGHVCVSM